MNEQVDEPLKDATAEGAATEASPAASDGRRPILVKVNIPFCYHRCDFCTRDVVAGWDSARMGRYVDALVREIGSCAGQFDDCEVGAVHLGGGIASMAGGEEILRVCEALRSAFSLADGAPITMRSSCASISGASMPLFSRAGVTRFDFEVMSLNAPDFLQIDFVNPIEKIPFVANSFLHARTRLNMGMVLLYGKKGIKPLDFRRSILGFTRGLSCHLIMQRYEGEDRADEAQVAEQLATVRDLVCGAGFVEYLPLRFAKPGCEDRFSLERSRGTEVMAFGMGAKSSFAGTETLATMDLDLYCAESAHPERILKVVARKDGETRQA